jgi:hypothetical protein
VSQSEHQIFESAARRVAGLLWGSNGHQAAHHGRQIDGRFPTTETVHYLEATTSRASSNTRDNAKKLADAIISARKTDPARDHRGWIITLHDPTHDQHEALKEVLHKKHGVRIDLLAFDRFRSRLINAGQYLELRAAAPFGSAEDPLQGTSQIEVPYVELGLIDEETDETVKVPDVVALLRSNDIFGAGDQIRPPRVLLLGEYGAGKSMTMRELFLRLRNAYQLEKSLRFPVLLSLRDHHGQDNPFEALERHARLIGFDNPAHLVRAWRGGQIVLLLDGFDELAPAGWARRNIDLKQFRAASSALVRNFLVQSPADCPILVAGRPSFFDDPVREMREALGLPSSTKRFRLDEFTEHQVGQFLRHVGWDRAIPTWLPRRPLLLGFLARRQLLGEVVAAGADQDDEATVWDTLIGRFCEREAKIDTQLDGTLVRQIAERLATLARRDLRGVGPIHQRELEETFRQTCGFDPTDKGLQLLSRLFCLGPVRDADGAREFVDVEVADALRAGEVFAFIQSNKNGGDLSAGVWQAPLQSVGMSLLTKRLQDARVTSKQLDAACDRSAGRDWDALLAELVISGAAAGIDVEKEHNVRGCNCPDLTISASTGAMHRVTFSECLFEVVSIDPQASAERVPAMRGCIIGTLEGPVALRDVPGNRFENTNVDEYTDSADANAKVRSLRLSVGRRVLVTVLRKLFLQRGKGRKEGAFVRGLSDEERALVPDVLNLVRSQGFAYPQKHQGETVWHPVRTYATRARECVARPSQSTDPLMLSADALSR